MAQSTVDVNFHTLRADIYADPDRRHCGLNRHSNYRNCNTRQPKQTQHTEIPSLAKTLWHEAFRCLQQHSHGSPASPLPTEREILTETVIIAPQLNCF